ncbi:MAG: Ig-like domain repeat protein [Erysipelotrichaceae bacterium]|jgi:hypothetical protein|nr:Ig-like domain repeat protein [Erysipelotrichaceae bacterium]
MGKFRKFVFASPLGILLASVMLALPSAKVAAAPVERPFNPLFDHWLDDFSGNTLVGTASEDAVYNDHAYLQVLTRNGATDAAAVYKYGTATPLATYHLRFTMRLAAGTFDPANYEIQLRGDDRWSLYPISLAACYDNFANPSITALGSEWQDVVISWNDSIEDAAAVYGGSTTTVLSQITGIHFVDVSNGTSDALIDIREFAGINIASEAVTVFDNFNRVDPNAGPDEISYWKGSVGIIVPKHLYLPAGATYEIYDDALEGLYAHVGLDINSKGLNLYARNGGAFAATGWTQDPDLLSVNERVSEAVSFAAISGDNTGTGVKIEATDDVTIYGVYLTNLESRTPEYALPDLDIENRQVISTFNFTKTAFESSYDDAIKNVTPEMKQSGLDFVIAYGGGNAVSANGNELVLDGEALGTGLVNVQFQGRANVSGQHLMVVIIKAVDGANMNNVRFEFGGQAALFIGTAAGAFGLGVLPTNTPWVDEAGYSYAIFNLDENKTAAGVGYLPNNLMTIYADGIGTGQVLIDEIFYTNALAPEINTVSQSIGAYPSGNIDQVGYSYFYGGYVAAGVEIISLKVQGSEGNISSLRLELNGSTYWFKDNVVIGVDGQPINAILGTTEPVTLDIDLMATTGSTSNGFDMHSHIGGLDGATGIVTLLSATTYDEQVVEILKDGPKLDNNEIAIAAGYSYAGALNFTGNVHRYWTITLDAGAVDSSALESIRMEGNGRTVWFKDGVVIGRDGAPIGVNLAAGENEITIDLVKTFGLDNIYQLTFVHVHTGDLPGTTFVGTLSLVDSTLHDEKYEPSELMALRVDPDFVPPEVTINVPGTVKIGSNVTVGVETEAGATTVISVVFGSGPTAVDVPVSAEGVFVADAEGIYTITVTVSDVAGNVTTETAQVTAIDDSVPPEFELDIPELVETGETITVTVDTEEGATVVISVTCDGEVVVVNEDGTFVADEDGTYIVEVTVTDAVGNTTTKSSEVVVRADIVAPEVTINAPATAKVNDEITVTVTTEAGATVNLSVKLGEKAITLVDGKFVATEAGTYTVTAVVSDAAGNTTTKTATITVTEATDTTPQDDGTTLYIVLGIVGGIVLLGVIAVLVYIFLIKPKKAR